VIFTLEEVTAEYVDVAATVAVTVQVIVAVLSEG
jgi:hypothetical protein